MSLRAVRIANGFVSALLALVLLTAAAYAGYALWDNQQIYHAADSVFDEMRGIMKHNEWLDEISTTPFGELRAINPDVNGWLTVPNTAIDYPLVRGANNFTYINTDVYGEFALSGSIFLDSRNAADYSDVYNLLYGHNMSKHRMFSDVNLFKDKTFFDENQTGTMITPEGQFELRSVSCILLPSSDSQMFNPENWSRVNAEQILTYSVRDAVCVSEDGMDLLRATLDAGERPRLLALSTCSSEFTDARTILLMLMIPVESSET